jgi:hypothetical protein
MILVGGYLGGLQGEELPKLEPAAIQKHWEEGSIIIAPPHLPLVLAGRFKQTTEGEKSFFLLLACQSSSRIDNQLWMHQLLEAYGHLGVYSGPVFHVAGNPEKVKRRAMGNLDTLFHGILGWVQERGPQELHQSVRFKMKAVCAEHSCHNPKPRHQIEAFPGG